MDQLLLEHTQSVARCMLRYQYIEFGLKSCLVRFHAAIRFRLAGYLPYEVPLDALEGAALGLLVKWFKLYSENQALITAMSKIKAERDFIAHQAYIFTLEEQSNPAHVQQRLRDLEQAHRRADECLALLQPEIEQAEQIVQRAYSDLRARSEAEGKSPPEAFNPRAINPPAPSEAEPLAQAERER